METFLKFSENTIFFTLILVYVFMATHAFKNGHYGFAVSFIVLAGTAFSSLILIN